MIGVPTIRVVRSFNEKVEMSKKYKNKSWTPHEDFFQFMWDGYLRVQASGLTNMFNCGYVADLALELFEVDMDRDDVLYIIKNYDNLKKYFGYGMEKHL